MPHVRSEQAKMRRQQIRAAKDFIWEYSFNDYLKSEAIARTDPSEVQTFLGEKFGFCDQSAVPCTFKGVVISDAYGRGAFQK